MNDDKKTLAWMILFGIVRSALLWAGGWLQAHGLIDADTHQRIMSEGVTKVVSYLLFIAPVAWSIAQKWQAMAWVRTALHLDPHTTSPGEVPVKSPGPDMPM